ncbi:hypothetical protein [Planomicrobium okeanokoites]|uniref:hypothetical protein n=1 Tax=Planomicrobium okeanokoites TaxID=244 RepID=UPI002492757D|nr:hypothetical protein [Planomicrobium okeanokoites]
MKIMVLDYLSPKNHSDLYNKIIFTLSKKAKVEVIAEEGYYDLHSEGWEEIVLKEYKINKNEKNMILRKLKSFKSMLKTRSLIKGNKSNIKLVLTFDTVTFGIFNSLSKMDNVCLLHHKNIDELENNFKKTIFKTYMNKVNHLVFEEKFKEYLIRSIGIEEKRIYVIPHPSFTKKTERYDTSTIDCIGLSNSNDEKFINAIIEYEKEHNFLKKNNLKVILRSKVYNYDNGFLKIISGFLPQADYDEYIKKCKIVFVPLPENFKYRVSGVMFDAFSNNKIVIANSTSFVRIYNKKYPNICIELDSELDFFNKLYDTKNIEVDENEFKKLQKNHNEKALLESFSKVIEGVLENESQ